MPCCFYGWFIAFLCGSLRIISVVAATNSINMVVDSFIKDLDITRTQVSVIWFVAIIGSASTTPFAGAFLDKYGPRKLL